MADLWTIVTAVAAALVAVGAHLRPRPADPPARETHLLPAPSSPAVSLTECMGCAALREDVREIERRERARDDAAAEYRGEVRAGLARIFERLRIRKEERHGGDRGSEG